MCASVCQRLERACVRCSLVHTVVMSHNLMDLSSEPDAIALESGLHAIVEMPARCPRRVCESFPLALSQILMVASAAEWH